MVDATEFGKQFGTLGGPLKKKPKTGSLLEVIYGKSKVPDITGEAGGITGAIENIKEKNPTTTDAEKKRGGNQKIFEGLGLDTILTPLDKDKKKKKDTPPLTDTLGG